MRYESQKTERGNVGVSYVSQEAADAQAVEMDDNDCFHCSRCSNCFNCSSCSGCTGCTGCINTIGAMQWGGEPAKNLLSINGLRWPVSTDGKSIQIGCQHHSVEDWKAFDDRVIAKMDKEALTFWTWYKAMILGLAEVRGLMDEAVK